jgi:hypothetical protein
MSFPSNPVNGQKATINGIVYNYNASVISWTRQVIANTGTGVYSSTVSVGNSTASTSTQTGALTVNGGAGIGGNVYVGGDLYINGAVPVQLAASFTPISGDTDFGSFNINVDAFGVQTDSYVTGLDFQISGPVQTLDLSTAGTITANPI